MDSLGEIKIKETLNGHTFYTRAVDNFWIKNGLVYNSKSKLCDGIFKNKIHSKIGWENCVPV